MEALQQECGLEVAGWMIPQVWCRIFGSVQLLRSYQKILRNCRGTLRGPVREEGRNVEAGRLLSPQALATLLGWGADKEVRRGPTQTSQFGTRIILIPNFVMNLLDG
ncbi:unnamed protein product [Rangifer tarandus platyrhynchus]|uniref:Uncharacterized protein n=1 Tax=Rangifer tarandus platyrhynchus TaxID=3082113 RepID=A0AC59YTK5_RANTA